MLLFRPDVVHRPANDQEHAAAEHPQQQVDLAQAGDGGTADLYVAVHEMIFRVLIGTLFSRGIDREQVEWLAERFDAMKPYINARFLSLGTLDWLPLPDIRRGKQALADLDAFVYDLMERRRAEGVREEGGDILDILLTTTDLQGNRLSDQTIRDECMMVLFGGHETTAGSLTWTLGLLADNPDKQNPMLFSNFLMRVQDLGVISRRQAQALYNRYFNVKFVSLRGDYNTCSQTCPVRDQVMSDMRAELHDKELGLMRASSDQGSFYRADNLLKEADLVLEATCRACANGSRQ